MKRPYGFEPSESCRNCKFRRNGFFCQVSPDELKDFDAVKFVSTYPAGAILFVEQQRSRGIYVLCDGLAKLSLNSKEGKTLILDIAQAGDVLGLFSAFSGTPYEVTAETLRPSQVAFVPSHDFRKFLAKHPTVLRRVTNHVGSQYETACEQLRRVGLGASVFEKVAQFLLAWSAQQGVSADGIPFTLSLSHEEIGEYVGITRESVTRALSELRHHGLIKKYGKSLLIPNRVNLQDVQENLRVSKEACLHMAQLRAIRRTRSPAIRPSFSRQAVRSRKTA
jgi:CRP/FNR family transcriptional regulator